MPEFDRETPLPKKRLVTGQVVLERINQHQELWKELWECLPLAKAFFGPEIEEPLRSLWAQNTAIWASATSYVDAEDDRDFARSCEADFWEAHGAARLERDKVKRALKEATSRAEHVLLPIVASETRLARQSGMGAS